MIATYGFIDRLTIERTIGEGPASRQLARLEQGLDNFLIAKVAIDDAVQTMIEELSQSGRGIGYTDARLMAAARLTIETQLWTHDNRLKAVA